MGKENYDVFIAIEKEKQKNTISTPWGFLCA